MLPYWVFDYVCYTLSTLDFSTDALKFTKSVFILVNNLSRTIKCPLLKVDKNLVYNHLNYNTFAALFIIFLFLFYFL